MGQVVAPKSLRSVAAFDLVDEKFAGVSGKKVSAVASLIAAASVSSGAQAQQSNLPPVTVDAPIERPRPTASKPSPEQVRARNAIRRAAQREQAAQQTAPTTPSGAPDGNPYADPAAPYKVDHVQASGKFPEKMLNTPKSITVLSKEVLEDKNATTLKEVGRSTAGVTLGSGEGGNAFGDRFFIRGFDARNDVFIDGIRDPAVSIRENFFTEQIEILRGPASSYAGRGTAGGAINIVTKQAGNRNFQRVDSEFGTDMTKRVTLDVNQVIDPTFSVRAGGLFQDANVAGRDHVTDNRWGSFISTKYTPTNDIKITTNYVHTDLSGYPDFGVPYYRQGNVPVTSAGIPRQNWYGFLNRDFQTARQDFGTGIIEYKVNEAITLTSKVRGEHSLLNYIGTLPQNPNTTSPNPLLWTTTASAQSRYQNVDVWANQNEATFKLDTGGVKHTAVFGVEYSNENISIDRYAGLASELSGSAFTSNGAVTGVNLYAPQYTYIPFGIPSLMGNPTRYGVNTTSVYVMDTANWQDTVIVNGGVRYDGYSQSASNNGPQYVKQSSDLVNYNVGLVYKPMSIGSIYGAYATSANPFGSELDATGTEYGGVPANSTILLGPERNKAIELGTKWELADRHLLVTGALFQTTKDNARETVNGLLTSGAAYRIQGIDIEAEGKITDRWSIFGGLVLMQSKVTQSGVASNLGLQLANIAHQSFSMLTKYKFDDGWELGGQAVYRSKVYGGTFAANTNELPSYWRFDAFVEKKIDKNWTMKFYAQNLTNKLYYDSFYRSAVPFVAVAPGRAFYVVTTAKF
ncbi:TonB-dependent siderophore receptor [Bradyrhizobium sp. WBOS7]|uniref:TonB-dependent siderophore receptor n=1 Tax=Bradyrhizobium betae TaxID=244734 RepID=A0AAE9N9G5_9BRAD|nr:MULTISPECIES: TonB-dependent receptor [Bradyrhizobium]MDD1573693.1 TonB-dependent siderophore receptor [Bradyrhizobium sp. WBOS1]UUO36404.1 TonB-dependent siderophore receptor [Bradyrhizobium sp. WBOS01]MDD1530226.1 TonB-dependent siderophore receptor [Bradyrhizobium sp. WBOS2]MDD1575145.1 TonB-dependent siderophore receptor [Bradyrhizobium sp. WBOS7]MDD1602736.1 TonB-dependent siderophore receptor [Bradyrhizobium sp. WBOS16]